MKKYLLIFITQIVVLQSVSAVTNDTIAVNQVQTNKTYCSFFTKGVTNSFNAWMGKKLVLARCYTPEGVLTSRVVNGTGTVREFYDSGTNKMVCSYVDGVKDGKKITWQRNGRVKYERGYSAGKRNGIWVHYYPDGSLQSEIIYTNNRELVKKYWDKKGKLLLDRDLRKKGKQQGKEGK